MGYSYPETCLSNGVSCAPSWVSLSLVCGTGEVAEALGYACGHHASSVPGPTQRSQEPQPRGMDGERANGCGDMGVFTEAKLRRGLNPTEGLGR
jgi:hypothetical protein